MTKQVCAICKRLILEKSSDFPFCSSRCKTIDLGSWLQESYKIPQTSLEEELILEGDNYESND